MRMDIGQLYSRQNVGLLNNYLQVIADFSSVTWNTQAKHEIAIVTGLVQVYIIPECIEDLVGAGSILLGNESLTNDYIASTVATAIDNEEVWLTTTPTKFLNMSNVIKQIVNGLDIGYEITGAALSGGKIKFHIFWEPINQTTQGSVEAGLGNTL